MLSQWPCLATIWEIRGFISERATLMSCSHTSLFRFFCFKLHQYGKSILRKIRGYEKCKNFEGKFSDTRIVFHLVAPKQMKTCGAKSVFLSVAFLKLNNILNL